VALVNAANVFVTTLFVAVVKYSKLAKPLVMFAVTRPFVAVVTLLFT
jgi:hypothetical protein